MGPTMLEVITTLIERGTSLTLDQRVYYYEAKQMGGLYAKYDPPIKSTADVKAFFTRYNRTITDEQIVDWLDTHNVPK